MMTSQQNSADQNCLESHHTLASQNTPESRGPQDEHHPRPHVVLVGPPGAGKTTIGRRLSRALNCEVVDTDLLIEDFAGKPCGEVFSTLGEPEFRQLEARMVQDALRTSGIVSLGGGAVVTPAVRDMLADHVVVHVDISAGEGVRRTSGKKGRPVLESADPLAHYSQLLQTRAPFYRAVSDHRVRTDGRSQQQVVTNILKFLESIREPAHPSAPSPADSLTSPPYRKVPAMDTTRITVTGPQPYDVVIGHNLDAQAVAHLKGAGAAKVGIVHQPPLAAPARLLAQELTSAGMEPVLLPIPDAEAAKTLEVAGQLWDELGKERFSRTDALLSLGGGATTDLTGFVAASWMRGIKVVHLPTTLLAMVDAAVGGKTGINTAAGKNLVGAFFEPSAVFVDLERLHTLPEAEIRAGSAEIIKTGFIHDPVIIERYLADPAACLDPLRVLPELVARSVAVKAAVVGEDLKEAGLRETLNYGHTFGHAVELREDYRWRHGNAVAVGMVFVAELAHARGLIDAELVETHRRILRDIGLPIAYEQGCFDELYDGMTRDKKNRDGNIRFVAITAVGETTRIEGPSREELEAAYARLA